MSLIRISESDDWIVDYETDSKTYRVSYFEDGHFVDQCRFEPYKDESYILEIKKELSLSEIEAIFGSTNIGVLDCSYMSDEEINRIVDEFNKVPN